ncbi:MAG: TonB-dependent receptor [Bacteroidales bacterium]|nr:TonB-dependent receptor [Bacteroidales bacterium]
MMKTSYLLKRLFVALAGLVLGASVLSAQNIKVTGVVTDSEKLPIMGAAVMVSGTSIGTATDLDGNFEIDVPTGAILEISSIGYETRKVKASPEMNVVLIEDAELLNESVVVGYGVQKRESLTGSISQIRSEDIAATRTANGVDALQGKIPGLQVMQNSGKPGQFNSDLSIRGYGNPMIVVDGVVRSVTRQRKNTRSWSNNARQLESYNDISVLQELNPDDIESISVLKDASATIYGLGAENGVILITTKKGQARKPSISFTASLNLAQPNIPRNVESWTSFMKWDNAMADVAKMGHRWSDETIAGYENGDPDLVYTDWYKESYKTFAVNQQYNASLSGGTDTVNYYFGVGYAEDNSILKGDTFGYKRYNVNANISVKLTNDLTMRYTSAIRQSNNLGMGSYDQEWNIFYYILASEPNVGVHTKDNPLHYSNVNEQMNPAALLDTDASGYTKTDSKNFNNTIDFTYVAPWLPGLRLSANGAYDYSTNKQRTLVKNFQLYDYWTDTTNSTMQVRNETEYVELVNDNARLYGRFQAQYERSFGKHNVSAMLGAELTDIKTSRLQASRRYGPSLDEFVYTHDILDQGDATTATNEGGRTNTRTAGYIGRLNYNYEGKYIVELMARYDGNYQFMKGKRWSLFPSYSLGWRVSEEKFFKQALPFVNNLKLRWSDGRTGSIQGSPYAYINGYGKSGSWVFNEGANSTGFANNSIANTVLTWATVRMMDFGVDFELWHGKLGGTFDWFRRVTSGIAATRSVNIPDFYAISIPQENLNVNENQGLELSLYHRNSIGDFSYRVQGQVSLTRSRMTYIESENTREYKSSMDYWKNCTLNRWNGYMGGSTYQWTGERFHNLYETNASQVLYDTNGSGEGNRALVPGMYQLVDRNGNGYIDGEDVFYTWGSSMPPLQFGLTIGGSYKNFDFNLIFSGAAMKSKSVSLSGFAGTGYLYFMPSQYTDSYHVANYGADPWDPATEWVEGYWPALVRVNQTGAAHNATYTNNQPYNYINATYLRLKTLELGYRVSPRFLQKAGIKSARVFFNGGNLLTFCNKLLKYVDPEASDNGRQGGDFPINRTYTFGFNLNF